MAFHTGGSATASRISRPLALALLAGMLATTLISAPAVRAAGGDGLRVAANGYRTAGGLAPVAGTALLDDIATARAADMRRKDKLEHDMQYVQDRLVRAGVCWSGYGEIIAWSRGYSDYSYDRTMTQWWNSTPHRTILMRPQYNAAGGAWARASDGGDYSVMVFVTLCGSDVPKTSFASTPFTDIGASPFRKDIEWLYAERITTGCTATSFCPTAPVTRAQMASFLDRVLGLPATKRDYFADDNGLVHEPAINRMAAAGITTGCAAGRYCPSSSITRDQMASLLVRAMEARSGAGLNLFDDDNRSIHEYDIDRLAYAGVTSGCASRLYCPTSVVTREQMAAFLRRAFSN